VDENNIYDGYTSASQFDNDGITMDDLLKASQLMAEAAERTLNKTVANIFAAPTYPKIGMGMDVTRYELNPRSFMLSPPLPPMINVIESEFCILEVTKVRERKKRFWEKFWASLSHWVYTPVEFYTIWEPVAFAIGNNTIYCHPSLAAEIRRKLTEV
jgi:hypothetical protein